MPAQAPTIATALKSMGYATGQFGKNHLGDLNEFLPTVHGFDEFFGYLYHLDAMEDPAHPNYPPELKDKIGPRNMVHTWATDADDPTEQPRWGKVGKQKIEDAGTLYPEADEDGGRRDSRPRAASSSTRRRPTASRSFCWLNPTRMHIVTHLSEKYEKHAHAENGWSMHEAGMAQLDDIVGAVMKKLKDDGLDDNTIVVFTTDNGAENFTWPDGGQTPFAGGKGTVMEGGFRVPCIVRWPGKVPAGKVENGIISGLDWFPTFVAAAGDPNIVEELKKGKKARRHDLQGASRRLQPDGPDHRQGPVEPPRDLLLRRGHARCGANRRLQVPLHRPARAAGSAARSSSTCRSSPTCGSIRSSARDSRIARVLRVVQVTSSGVSSMSSRRSAKLAQTAIEFPPIAP